jgi:hypothetical protein
MRVGEIPPFFYFQHGCVTKKGGYIVKVRIVSYGPLAAAQMPPIGCCFSVIQPLSVFVRYSSE